MIVADAAFVDIARAAAGPGQRVEALPAFPASSRPLDDDPATDATVVVLHTSGSTGVPKSVAARQASVAGRVRSSVALTGVGPGSVYCTMSPFQHQAGVGNVLNVLAVGGTIALAPPFSAESWGWLATIGTTHALLVPTMIDRLLDRDALPLPDLEVLSYGAAPVHPDTLVALQAALPEIGLVQIYGMTEGSPLTGLTVDDHRSGAAGRREILLSVGRAAPGIELQIVEPDGTGVGEVWARGDQVYLPDADGWIHTGDLGRIDADGYLHLVGRRADRIVRGGENIEAVEVEDVLASHPLVREAVVVGAPDREMGELVRAFVVAAGERPTVEELRAFARERLAGFKVPTEWSFVDELPRNESGKLLRRGMRDWEP